ncbi:hypothetical protein PG984_016501 [Apiospora sp. TS-2023a]
MDLEDRQGNVPATNNRLSTLDAIGGGAALRSSSKATGGFNADRTPLSCMRPRYGCLLKQGRTLASHSGKRPPLFYASKRPPAQYLSYYFDNMAI